MKQTNLHGLVTETRNQDTMNIDELSTQEIIDVICTEDQKAVKAVQNESQKMSRAVELIVASLRNGGRVFYIGSGTSGRLGVLDAAELLPTFGVGEDVFKAIIAGGETAMFHPAEKAEDDYPAGITDLLAENPTANDIVIGISASGRTPYVIGALEKARELGMGTIGLTCNRETPMNAIADLVIAPVVGPEVIAGSTRMKAGTAQKLVLNILSTVSMIRVGKVYQNLMVDMQPTNEKLQRRSERIIMDATGVDIKTAQRALEESHGNIKASIVMLKANCDFQKAMQLLVDGDGFVRKAIRLAEYVD
ncbi:MAG TPA: N-acetylmuramic acid 6-phosphate etherase [Firmicutes bacterium]|nr:N-acetylmuramic acid 6-phosphate etherase [Bacillota bacterium]